MANAKSLERTVLIGAGLVVGLGLALWSRPDPVPAPAWRQWPAYDKCLASGRTEMACDAAMRVTEREREETLRSLEQDCPKSPKPVDKTLCKYPPLTSDADAECRAKGIDPDDNPFARIMGGCPTLLPPKKPMEAAK